MTEMIRIRRLPQSARPADMGSGQFQIRAASPLSLSFSPWVSGVVSSPYWGGHAGLLVGQLQQEPGGCLKWGSLLLPICLVAGAVLGAKDVALNTIDRAPVLP